MTLGISGIQETQRGVNEIMATFKPGGKFSKAIWRITMSLHRYAVSITHVVTGALRASHRQRMASDTIGFIWLDSGAVNPRTHEQPFRYGMYEEARGGDHAFYMRTVNEAAPGVVQQETRGLI